MQPLPLIRNDLLASFRKPRICMSHYQDYHREFLMRRHNRPRPGRVLREYRGTVPFTVAAKDLGGDSGRPAENSALPFKMRDRDMGAEAVRTGVLPKTGGVRVRRPAFEPAVSGREFPFNRGKYWEFATRVGAKLVARIAFHAGLFRCSRQPRSGIFQGSAPLDRHKQDGTP